MEFFFLFGGNRSHTHLDSTTRRCQKQYTSRFHVVHVCSWFRRRHWSLVAKISVLWMRVCLFVYLFIYFFLVILDWNGRLLPQTVHGNPAFCSSTFISFFVDFVCVCSTSSALRVDDNWIVSLYSQDINHLSPSFAYCILIRTVQFLSAISQIDHQTINNQSHHHVLSTRQSTSTSTYSSIWDSIFLVFHQNQTAIDSNIFK